MVPQMLLGIFSHTDSVLNLPYEVTRWLNLPKYLLVASFPQLIHIFCSNHLEEISSSTFFRGLHGKPQLFFLPPFAMSIIAYTIKHLEPNSFFVPAFKE